MANITSEGAVVYRAPSLGRRFLTLKAACRKEANAQILAKYSYEFDFDHEIFMDEKLMMLRDRLERALYNRFLKR